MKHIELENELKAFIRKRRIIESILGVVFLIIAIGFSVAREQSKNIEEIGWGPFRYQSVTYNENFQWGIMVGVFGVVIFATLLIADLIYSKVITVEVNGDYITLYRGSIHTNLYVNGEFKDGIVIIGYYLAATLSDNTKVNVALGRWTAHMSFANGHPPIDV